MDVRPKSISLGRGTIKPPIVSGAKTSWIPGFLCPNRLFGPRSYNGCPRAGAKPIFCGFRQIHGTTGTGKRGVCFAKMSVGTV